MAYTVSASFRAFLEATAQQLSPQVVMGFAGIHSPRSKPDEHT